MYKPDHVRTRAAKGNDLVDIAECFSNDPAWAAEHTPDETVELVTNEVIVLAVHVPPSDKPTELFACYMSGCDQPLFVQAKDASERLYEVESVEPGEARPRSRFRVFRH